jgi:glycosyltransferase involved in cell wall biosynthesis
MPSPVISVIIPTRNRAHYLPAALDSVFTQTFTDYEIIVVDDGSTDNTQELLAPLAKAKKIQVVAQAPAGVSAARNRGVSLARAPYIAFLDSDDLFLPTKLEKQLRLFQAEPNLGFVHCSFAKFEDQGPELGVRDTSRFSGWIYPQILKEWSVLMAMPCMLVRTDAIKEVGGFDESLTWAEDLDLWRRLARRYPVGVIPEALVRVRVHAASTSFERGKGAVGFERFLEKAFTEDHDLSPLFKRQAKASMHAKLGQNLLADGGTQEMKQVRRHCSTALASWPYQLGALATWIASWLPARMRHEMATWHRRRRYLVAKGEKL